MRNGPRRHSSNSRGRAPSESQPKRWSPPPNQSRNAQRNYEHHIALARAAAINGDTIEAETHYQYAEHYYRSMSANSQDT